jgi:hypothetical protein
MVVVALSDCGEPLLLAAAAIAPVASAAGMPMPRTILRVSFVVFICLSSLGVFRAINPE